MKLLGLNVHASLRTSDLCLQLAVLWLNFFFLIPAYCTPSNGAFALPFLVPSLVVLSFPQNTGSLPWENRGDFDNLRRVCMSFCVSFLPCAVADFGIDISHPVLGIGSAIGNKAAQSQAISSSAAVAVTGHVRCFPHARQHTLQQEVWLRWPQGTCSHAALRRHGSHATAS